MPASLILRLLILTAASLAAGGCSLGYYAQSITGHVEILLKQRPVTAVIAGEDTEPAIREKLAEVEQILAFAHREIGLPDNGSYRKYADLGRKYVVWNIFAAPELAIPPRKWCYLVVGCVNYRGYYDQADALSYARDLEQAGWDVNVSGVTAYSTLGWFRDPLINTMLNRPNWEIARLIFHELAHQKLYFENHTTFNEAFADAVAMIALDKWLETRPRALRDSVRQMLAREDAFIGLVLKTRDELTAVYESARPDDEKRSHKARIIGELERDYRVLRAAWGDNDTRFDKWVYGGVNNAKLAAVSTYRLLVPDFLAAYEAAGSDLNEFYARVEDLAAYGKNERIVKLKQAGLAVTAGSGDFDASGGNLWTLPR